MQAVKAQETFDLAQGEIMNQEELDLTMDLLQRAQEERNRQESAKECFVDARSDLAGHDGSNLAKGRTPSERSALDAELESRHTRVAQKLDNAFSHLRVRIVRLIVYTARESHYLT